jgi:hypothetical protein
MCCLTVTCSKFLFPYLHVCCTCCVLCGDITSCCYWIVWLFLFYDSVNSNWWLWCMGHAMFNGRRWLCGVNVLGGLFGYILLWWVYFITRLKLCVSVKVSFICSFCSLKLYMHRYSTEFSNWPFFTICAFLMSDHLYHMCVLCWVCVGHILSFVYLSSWPG